MKSVAAMGPDAVANGCDAHALLAAWIDDRLCRAGALLCTPNDALDHPFCTFM